MNKQQQIKKFRDNIPDLHNGAFRKEYDKAIKRKSFRSAVKLKCLDCMGFQSAEVAKCDIYSCPLHAYRPYGREKPKKKDQNKS